MAAKRKGTRNPQRGALELVTGSVEETAAFGVRLGKALGAGDVVALYGELGSGKTTLIQGVAQGLRLAPEAVKSPTFVLVREYHGDPALIHVDGYRLEGAQAAWFLDVDLLFSSHKVTVLEWADRFAGLLPEDRVEVQMSHVSTNRRQLQVSATGARSSEVIANLQVHGSTANTTSLQPEPHPDVHPGD